MKKRIGKREKSGKNHTKLGKMMESFPKHQQEFETSMKWNPGD